MSRLLLVRHGQSTWNAAGRWQGRADPPLSELGERQAEAVAAALAPGAPGAYKVTAVWTSPLERAHRTATIVGELIGVPMSGDARLAELDAGEWTGLTKAEIDEAWPGYLADGRRPPGFEPYDALLRRALEVLDEIAATGGTPLVVTHAGLIRTVERHLGADDQPVPNLGGRELVAGPAGLELGDPLLLVDPASVEVTTPRQI